MANLKEIIVRYVCACSHSVFLFFLFRCAIHHWFVITVDALGIHCKIEANERDGIVRRGGERTIIQGSKRKNTWEDKEQAFGFECLVLVWLLIQNDSTISGNCLSIGCSKLSSLIHITNEWDNNRARPHFGLEYHRKPETGK